MGAEPSIKAFCNGQDAGLVAIELQVGEDLGEHLLGSQNFGGWKNKVINRVETSLLHGGHAGLEMLTQKREFFSERLH